MLELMWAAALSIAMGCRANSAGNTAAVKSSSAPIIYGDLLRIEIPDVIGPGVISGHVMRVDHNGLISMPVIGLVRVRDLSPRDAELVIREIYRRDTCAGALPVRVIRLESGTAPSIKLGPIEPGEFLRVTMEGIQQQGVGSVFAKQVAADGTVDFPLVGRVLVAGVTDDVAADRIRSKGRRLYGVSVRKVSAKHAARFATTQLALDAADQ